MAQKRTNLYGKMNLNDLFELFAEKGLTYIDCRVNKNGYFNAYASTGYNGRGNAIEFIYKHHENNIRVRLLKRGEALIEKTFSNHESALEFMENFNTKQ